MRTLSLLPVLSLLLVGCPKSEAPNVKKDPAPTSARQLAETCDDARLTLAADRVVARVDGQALTAGDVEGLKAAEEAALRKYCSEVSTARQSAVQARVDEMLIDRQAKAAGQSREDFLRTAAEKAAANITEEEAKAFFEARKSPQAPPYEAVADQVREALAQERQGVAIRALIMSARAGVSVDLQLPDTRPPAVEIAINAHNKFAGPADAQVTVVKYSDFECPYCQVMANALDDVKKKLDGKSVRFVYKHFPLSFHPHARRAAEASQCAAAQGKFWQMHDTIFANMDKLDDESLSAHAQTAGADLKVFEGCMSAGSARDEVQADYEEGERVGVSGTPTLFINGHKFEGGNDPSAIVAAIEKELTR